MFYQFNEIGQNKEHYSSIGKKSENPIKMFKLGIPVPEGACLAADAFDEFIVFNKFENLKYEIDELPKKNINIAIDTAKIIHEKIVNGLFPESIKQMIESFILKLKGNRFAVRSSSFNEDIESKICAGFYASFLNLKHIDDIVDAVKKCWASAFDEKVIKYCSNRFISIENLQMGVIIQKMIASDKSGVIFSVNPLKGFDKEMLIEAYFGSYDSLTKGELIPDQYFYDWYNGVENKRIISDKLKSIISIDEPPFIKEIENTLDKRNQEVLDINEIKQLSEITLKIQEHYGFPVEVEWVKKNDNFFIVQVCPIIKIDYSGIDGEWTILDFKDSGISSSVCKPFIWSLYDIVREKRIPEYLETKMNYQRPKNIFYGYILFGRPYWNLSIVKEAFRNLPKFIEKDFDEVIGLRSNEENKFKISLKQRIKSISTLYKMKKEFKTELRNALSVKSEKRKELAEFSEVNPYSMNKEDFFTFYKNFIKQNFYDNESISFNLIFDSVCFYSIFYGDCKKFDKTFNYLNLISGLANVPHLVPSFLLWDIRKKIKSNPVSEAFWINKSTSELVDLWKNNFKENYMDDVSDFINEFKYFSIREIDISVPRYGENPDFVISSIKNFLDLDDSCDPRKLNSIQNKKHFEEKKKLLSLIPFFKRKKINKTIKLLRSFLWSREEYRDISIRFYYHIRRFTLAIAKHLIEMDLIDEENDIFFLPVDYIFSIIEGKYLKEDIKSFIKKNKSYYLSFRNLKTDEIGKKYVYKASHHIPVNKKVLKGIGCSSGIVTGKAKIINSFYDLENIQKEDIIITTYADSSWAFKFSIASGIAAENGGILSHSALIAREYGIPAVFGIYGLTSIIKNGDFITLNGNNGEILLNENKTS
ncbi:MAG: hypothetical protein HQK76_10295 [Desulfobacterales bacterium]|nr:hypothetical protein [Desulfobacterales bacterium]